MGLKAILAALRATLRPRPKPRPKPPAPKPAPRPTPAPVPAPAPPAPSPGDDAAELMVEHNLRRSASGLSPFGSSVSLRLAAQGHVDQMARMGTMAHSGIGDGDLASRLMDVGYRFRSAGENIAMGQHVAAVMAAWMTSSGHKANILNPSFTAAGFAVVTGTSGKFWCSVFGSPAIAAPPGIYAGQLPYTVGTPVVTTDGKVAASSIAIAANGS